MIANALKNFRSERRISQEELANLLELSRNTVIAIEKGEREMSLSEAEKLSSILGVSVEALFADKLPNFPKYKEMILFILSLVGGDTKIPKTKLAKILYLADFAWFYYEMESMSGMSYRKNHYGPVPDEYFRALEELEQGGLTSLEVKSTPDYVTHLVSLTEAGSIADTKQVNTAEKRLIKKIFKKWEDKTTSVIVGFTHQQLPFLLAQEGETISYALIGQVEEKNLF